MDPLIKMAALLSAADRKSQDPSIQKRNCGAHLLPRSLITRK